MVADPSIAKVRADLGDDDLVEGVNLGKWRILSYEHPRLDFAVTAVEPDGRAGEYGFKADLLNFPVTAPQVWVWDHERDRLLPAPLRPKGGARLVSAFKDWGSKTVYRPWDRMTGPHNNNAAKLPHLAWNSDRRLVFIFEDLHGLLTSNARACRSRPAA